MKNKVLLGMFSATIISIIVYVVCKALEEPDKAIQHKIETSLNTKVVSIPRYTDVKAVTNQRILALEQKMKDIYAQARIMGGRSNTNTLAYEELWCIAAEDLSKEDQAYAYNQYQDWLKKKEMGPLSYVNNNLVSDNMQNYLQMDVKALQDAAFGGDIGALRALASGVNDEISRALSYKAAQRLTAIGEWDAGISTLVIDDLSEAEFIMDEDATKAQQHIVRALSYAEIAFQQASTAGLSSLLIVLKDSPQLQRLMSRIDESLVEGSVSRLIAELDKTRLAEGLRPFEEMTVPRVALSVFQQSIAKMYDEGGNAEFLRLLQDKTLFPGYWQVQYLDTPCIKRRIATREANFHLIPAIQEEIRSLQNHFDTVP
ncbi:hypothetical protein J8L98_10190 [Pseudoalteromonas sp. MMG013]|uniref:hypothetical protein n=1 Tax=Pseudoalteromonas sp. MMG013 TaxID=2822687 RepID=UPI001B383093|nr:hypothetical protein [Pseudoalteromonas sp. MMG013]MBQ4862059.1 hypothetical protein [Pseudoalteromonas sp. MMG013]